VVAALEQRSEDRVAMPGTRQLQLAALHRIAGFADYGADDPELRKRRGLKASFWVDLVARLAASEGGPLRSIPPRRARWARRVERASI